MDCTRNIPPWKGEQLICMHRSLQTEEQLRDAFSVRKQVFVKEQQVSAEEEYDEFEETSIHVVIYDNDVPVGAGRFRTIDGIGKMERICVLASHRKKASEKLL